MTCHRISDGIICSTQEFKPGDPRPAGYLAFHAWAEVQVKAGLKQERCGIGIADSCYRVTQTNGVSDVEKIK